MLKMSVNQDEQEDRIRPDAQQEQLPFLEIPSMSESYGQVAGAAVSLECFVPAYAEAWFRKAEAKFADCNVTREHTKYRKVLQALPVEMISKLHAFLEDDPLKGEQPYSRLKQTLLEMYKKTTSEQLTALFEALTLGDQRPSDLLNEMLRRAGRDVSEKFLEPMWLSKLPVVVSAAVSALNVPLREKGKQADQVMDKVSFRNNPFAQASVAQVSQVPQQENVMLALTEAMSLLRQEVAELKQQRSRTEERGRGNPRRHDSRRRSRGPSQERRRDRYTLEDEMCFAHRKFGDQARWCVKGCKHFGSKN